jgi:electron-transferring-flavoprotein dehydrogenase
LKKTWVYKDLHLERNVKGAFKYGLIPGVAYAGLTSFIMKGKEPWNIKGYKKDSLAIKPIKDCQVIYNFKIIFFKSISRFY